MSLDFDAMLQPISDATPGGTEQRDSETYEQLNEEMAKLTSLADEGIPNWTKVEQLASEFLQTESKDYLVAAWLAQSWVERNAMQGLACGLSLLSGMADRFWDTGFPSIKRLRGRRNAILWWVDRSTQWLESQTDVAIAADLSEKMTSAAKALDQTLSEKDPESPSLATLIGLLHRLPVEEPPQAEVSAEAKSAQSAAPSSATTGPENTADLPAKQSPQVSQDQQRPSQATALPTSAPKLGALDKAIQINNLEDLGAALKPAQDYVALLGPALYAFDNSHPLVIHFSRFASRSGIFKLPQAKAGKTLIGCPPGAILDAFEKITGSKNPQGIVDFCESRIRTFPFWFDLDYQSFRGFSMMGVAGNLMARTIVDTLLNFTNRLPEIEQMTFSDGTPFASVDTLAWLKRCRQERSGGGVSTDAFAAAKSAAMATLGEGKLEDAIHQLQVFVDTTRSKRDQFRARIELADILLSERPTADLRALVQPLIDDCEQLQLDQWEPALAAQAWALKVRAARQVSKNKSDEVTEAQRAAARLELEVALKHLSITDFAQAAQMT